MSMDNPLVWKLPNSTNLPLPGIWNNKPGVKRMKSTTDTKIGPQSAIFFLCVSLVSYFTIYLNYGLYTLWSHKIKVEIMGHKKEMG